MVKADDLSDYSTSHIYVKNTNEVFTIEAKRNNVYGYDSPLTKVKCTNGEDTRGENGNSFAIKQKSKCGEGFAYDGTNIED